jgi:hypothetical protein
MAKIQGCKRPENAPAKNKQPAKKTFGMALCALLKHNKNRNGNFRVKRAQAGCCYIGQILLHFIIAHEMKQLRQNLNMTLRMIIFLQESKNLRRTPAISDKQHEDLKQHSHENKLRSNFSHHGDISSGAVRRRRLHVQHDADIRIV